MSPHPSAARLRAFQEGSLDAEVGSTVAAHVEACDTCQEALDHLSPFGDGASATRPPDESAGDRPAVPGFEIAEEVGRGGMGVVYRARDVELGRDVAVKLLQHRFGPHSAAARRFVEEASITGQLQHPGVPAVHRVGTLADGRPFLAMKLVKGHTLDALLRARTDPAADTARFAAAFEQVCQAVAYAHARRVVHRDLKPANVMVGAFGEVQVMDWGLAKVLGPATDGPPDAATVTEVGAARAAADETRAGSSLGTPAFMAPEQATGAVDVIDERTDVFGLGGILCVTLTGLPPYAGVSAEATRRMAAGGELAAARERLAGCGGDPDLVLLCLHCLAAAPGDRPPSAAAVAGVVTGLRAAAEERARRAELDRAAAVLREAERRKRRPLWVGLAAALVAGLVAAAWLAVHAERERSRTAEALQRVEDEKGKSQTALARAEAVTGFLTDDVLAQASPDRSLLGEKGTFGQVFRRVAARLDGRFPDQPLVEAAVRHAVGDVFRELRDPAAAVIHLERALTLRRRALGPDDALTLLTQVVLARVQRNRGHDAEAAALLDDARDRAAALGPDHRVSLLVRYNQARRVQDREQNEAAVRAFLALVADQERALGVEHPDTLQSQYGLMMAYDAAGEGAKAELAAAKLLPVVLRRYGDTHSYVSEVRRLEVAAYDRRGEPEQGTAVLRDMWQAVRQRYGDDHADTLAVQAAYGDRLERVGGRKEAERLFRDLAARSRKTFPADDIHRFDFVGRLGRYLLWVDRPLDAEPILREAYEGSREIAPESPITIDLLVKLRKATRLLAERAEHSGLEAAADDWRAKLAALPALPAGFDPR